MSEWCWRNCRCGVRSLLPLSLRRPVAASGVHRMAASPRSADSLTLRFGKTLGKKFPA